MEQENSEPVRGWNVEWLRVVGARVLAAYGDLASGGLRVVWRVGREVVLAVEGVAQHEAAPEVHVARRLLRQLLLPAVVPVRAHAVQEPANVAG